MRFGRHAARRDDAPGVRSVRQGRRIKCRREPRTAAEGAFGGRHPTQRSAIDPADGRYRGAVGPRNDPAKKIAPVWEEDSLRRVTADDDGACEHVWKLLGVTLISGEGTTTQYECADCGSVTYRAP